MPTEGVEGELGEGYLMGRAQPYSSAKLSDHLARVKSREKWVGDGQDLTP